MQNAVHLWDGGEITSKAILLLKNQLNEYEEYNKAGLIEKAEHLYIVPDSLSDNLYTVLKFLEYKHAHTLPPLPLNKTEKEFFNKWEQMVDLNTPIDFTGENFPEKLHKCEYLIEIINEILIIREQLLSTSYLSGFDSVYFSHNWWDSRIKYIEILDNYIGKAKKIKKSSTLFIRIDKYVKDINEVFNKIKISNIETILKIASSYCFSAGKFSLTHNQLDKAMLLLHRCVDLYFQSIGAEYRLVSKSIEGLTYNSTDLNNKDVSLDRTKKLLLLRNHISLTEDQSKLVDRINFIRNRSILTHSMYSIHLNDIENYFNKIYRLLTNMEGEENSWRNEIRTFLSKPEIHLSDIFDIEDSFDAYITIRN